MPYDVRQSMTDALDACRTIQTFTVGQTIEIYRADKMRRLAVERLFEILGEAFCRIEDADPSFRGHLPEMGSIIGMRNRVIHGYDRVDDEIIWVAVEKYVPPLMAKLAAWLEKKQP